MRPRIRGTAFLCAALFLGACSKRDTGSSKDVGTAKPSTSDSTSMAGTPGMKMKKGDAGEGKPDGAKGEDSSSTTFTAAQVQHGNVQWSPAVAGMAATTVTVPGQLVPNEDRTARLGAPARGRVVSVRAQPGDQVSRGQVLVSLESPEAGVAQSDVSKAQADVTSRRAQAQYARAARERAERLLKLKAIPRQDYEHAIADDEAAQASLTQAQAELTRAQSTAEHLNVGTDASGMIALASPLSGVVLARTAAPGTVVEAGAPLIVVTDPASLWLQISAPEKFAALFRRGATLRFTVPVYPGQTFVAHTEAIGAGLDPETRTLSVRASVASDGRLKAEMLASVSVESDGRVAAVVVPDDGVQTLDSKTVVFLVTPDGKGGARFDAREVDVASRSGGRVVIARGVKVGDLIVTQGAIAVKAQIKKSSMVEEM